MANRQLDADELAKANVLLDDVRRRLEELSVGDPELLFAFRRKVWKELMYGERGKPGVRRALKQKKWQTQQGLCAICSEAMPLPYSELDRFDAKAGYTETNTRLVHHECHIADQAMKSYS